MTPKIDRRGFLALSVGALAWACTRGSDDDDTASTAEPAASGDISLLAGAPMLAMGDTRQPLVILRGQRPIAPKDARFTLSGPGIEAFDVSASHYTVTRGLGGDDDPHNDDHTHAPGTEVDDIFVVRHDFDRAGVWDAAVSFDGGRATATFQVLDDVKAPKVGDDAIASKSPTTSNARDVDPICTRDPVCSLHDMTIAEALEASKPIVVTFATPRFCASRACGPVVDLVQAEKERVGDDASFLHIEVWKNDKDAVNKTQAPAFAEWSLDAEPWTYFIDAKGKVTDRWLGPVAADELTKAVDALLEA
jgi:hypothetical protein